MNLVAVLAVGSGLAFVAYGTLCLTSSAMQAEFVRFGLERFRVATGLVEVMAGVGLLVGLKWPLALSVSSGGIALLMLSIVVMRVAVHDRPIDIFPALALLGVNGYIAWASWTPV